MFSRINTPSWRLIGLMTVAALLVGLAVTPARASLSDCIDATCRIKAPITMPNGSPGTGVGTGVVFEISKGNVYVLTNSHVATSTTVQLEFWSQGHQSRALTGTTIMRNAAADAAVVRIDAAKFGERLPTAIPIDRSGQSMRVGQTILSVGCANSSWSTGWRGHVIRDDGNDLYFLPTPADGRSGSAIFDAAGEKIVGLLRGRYDGEQGGQPHGVATSAARIRSVFASPSGERKTQQQCGPNGCPTDNTQWRLSPYRYNQDRRNDAQDKRIDSLYPTMPQQDLPPAATMLPVAPVVAPIDLTPVTMGLDRLANGQDRITQLLIQMRDEAVTRPSPFDVPPLPDGALLPQAVDPLANDALVVAEEARAGVEWLTAGHNNLAESVSVLSDNQIKLSDTVKAMSAESMRVSAENMGAIDRIKTRVAEAKENGAEGMKQIASTVVWGVIKSHGLLTGGIFGLVIFGVWRDVKAKITTGDPLLVEKIYSRISDRFESVGDRVRDRFRNNEPLPPAAPAATVVPVAVVAAPAPVAPAPMPPATAAPPMLVPAPVAATDAITAVA